MPKKKILIDSSIWIEFLKGNNSKIIQKINDLQKEDLICICGMVLCEVLCGFKKESERADISLNIKSFNFINEDESTWEKAADIFINLKEKGSATPLSDCIVAAVAINNGLKIYSLDKHFESIDGVDLFQYS
ncbi:MAG: PIN domain-containing protein [Actinobacteria bacterium]|nr:PIN domain-containing protein [Actinomycetota bacterium]